MPAKIQTITSASPEPSGSPNKRSPKSSKKNVLTVAGPTHQQAPSKEELQSLNEELTALNGQLQETLEHQRTTSNDLQNILYSTAVATLFLDADLNIKFFTPATKTLFDVIPGDIGRPLANLTSFAMDATLLSDAEVC